MAKHTPRKTLYLIDGHAQFFRAYHAIRSGMTSPVTQEPTNMTFGFVGMILKVLRDYKPDYLAVVIDKAGDRETFRSEIYADYKANRTPPPDDFKPQVRRCLSVLDLMKIPVIAVDSVEADDVIATVVRRMREDHPDVAVRIVTKDKDLAALTDGDVELFDVHTDLTVTPEELFKTEGVRPEHVRDILALMGDTVDNVPGVPGIGPKTAAKLVLQYGSLDEVIKHAEEIGGKRGRAIAEAKEQLEVSRRLVTLLEDCDLEFDLDAARVNLETLPVERMLETMRELGFNRYQQEITALRSRMATAAARASAKGDRAGEDAGLFDQVAATVLERKAYPAEYRIVTTKKDLAALRKTLEKATFFAVDTETDRLSSIEGRLCGLAFSVKAGEGWYVPTRSPNCEAHLGVEEVLDELRAVLEDPEKGKIGHNLKYDLNVLRRHGVRLGGVAFDTMVASYLIEPARSSHKLDVLALAMLNHTCTPIEELIGRGRKQRPFDEVPVEDAGPYSVEDVDMTLRLHEIFQGQLEEIGLTELFRDVEMPLVEVLAELEWNGIRVDPDVLDEQREELNERIEELKREIQAEAGREFNPDSPKQLQEVLFNKPDDEPPGLGIKPIKHGRTGPSTDQTVLERLAADGKVESRLPELILEYRSLTKLVSTYLVALKEAINPRTGRVHASVNQTVAATGRLSSSDPNLQNIPIRTDVGRRIRRAFVADEGHRLVTADYSQIELRVLAHLADEPGLKEAFESGEDIHTAVAAEIYGVGPGEVTDTQRRNAKMVNYGIVYGVTPWGLARRLGPDVSVDDAKEIIARYKRRFEKIDEFLDLCIRTAERRGYVETILGRRRPIPQIHARHPQTRGLGERMAINSVVQGSAADLIKVAMVRVHRRLPKRFEDDQVRLLLQIHDELVLEAPASIADEVGAFAAETMEGAMDLSVPLQADVGVSDRWIDAK